MSGPEPGDSDDLSMMWRVAAALTRDRPRAGPELRLLDPILREFRPLDESTLLQEVARASVPLDLGRDYGWVLGRPLPRTATPTVPVINVQLDGDNTLVTRCCIRVAVVRERGDGTVEALGWRFELAEDGEDSPHPYQHAQPVIGWTVDGVCLIHPPVVCFPDCTGVDLSGDDSLDEERAQVIGRLDQSQPAFALSTQTLTGLMLNVVTTLYGAAATRALLGNEPRLGRAGGVIADDISRLLG